jgi:hypothetical protein
VRGFSIEAMERGKAAAMRDRNRGYCVGKPAAGWIRRRVRSERGKVTSAEIAHMYGTTAVANAIEEFMRDNYPWRYDGLGDEFFAS